jgi:hypothetical protein
VTVSRIGVVSSRLEQKQKLRAEREERERQDRETAARRNRMLQIGTAVAVVVVAAVVAVVALSGGGSSNGKGKPRGTDTAGLQVSAGPWPPSYVNLEKRVKALALPDPSDLVYHVHADIAVYTDGKKQTVPANIGIDQSSQFLASLHTHDASGVVHMEAVQPYPFKLGQFFDVWGVKFTPTQLGAYHAGKGLVLQAWVNGKQVKDFVNYPMKSHDRIVVGFGKPGSFPTKNNFQFPAGE